jgi:hypothetical protein
MRLTRDKILKALNSISVIIFIGLCIDAGGFIFNTLYVLFTIHLELNSFGTELICRDCITTITGFSFWLIQ